jgi:hypothetical protein
LLIERNHHICKAHSAFEKNFKTRFTAADSKLFDNTLLNLLFESETQLEKAKLDFIKELSQPLDPNIIAKAQSARAIAGGSVQSSNEIGNDDLFVNDLVAVNDLNESQAGGSSMSSSSHSSRIDKFSSLQVAVRMTIVGRTGKDFNYTEELGGSPNLENKLKTGKSLPRD